MTKHLGSIIVLVVVAGIVLYIAQHFGDLLNGLSLARQMFESRIL